MKEQINQKSRGRRLKKAGLWSGGLIVAIAIATVLTVLSIIGTRISAPDWLRARITEQINQDVQGLSLDFGELAIVLQNDWVPRLMMQSVVVSDDYGTPVVQLSDLQGTVALGPMLRGDLRPGSINLSGARLTLRRAADGTVDFRLGDSGGAVEQAANLAALIEQADAFFQRPHFASLKNVSADNLIVQYEDARAGKAWTVDGGRVSLSRDDDDLSITSDFVLLGDRDFATTLELGYNGKIGSSAAEFTVSLEDMPASDIAGQSPALSWLNALDAPISGSLKALVDDDGALGPLAAKLEIGEGFLNPNDAARPLAFDHASAEFTYDPETFLIRFVDLQLDSKWVNTRIEGQTRLAGMEDGWPDALISQFQVNALSANPMEIYEAPIALDGATLDMRLRLDPFEVTLGELSITDQGRDMHVTGAVAAEEDGWTVAVDALVPNITPNRLLELWPQNLEPKTRTWITNNVKTAELSNIQFALRSQPAENPDVYLGFDFDALETRFIKNVPHIEGARGTASIYDNQFVITAHAGYVTAAQGGRIDITGSSFDIPDVRIKRGPGVVRLRTQSSITAALSLLDEEPFRFLQKAGRPVTLADGSAQLSGRLDFAVVDDLTPDGVAFEVTGTLNDVQSYTLVEDRVIASSELWVDATSEVLKLGGSGKVGQVPFEGTWTMPLVAGSNGRAQVDGSIELSERFLDEFKIGLPPGSVTGVGRGRIKIDFAQGVPPVFQLTSDLAGLALRLKPLDWSAGADETGDLSVRGTLAEPPSVDELRLNASGLQAQGSVSLKPDGQLQQASFSRVQLGTWIDAAVDLVGLGPDQAPLVRVVGGEIDLRQTSLAGSGDPATPGSNGGPISLRLDKLQISDGIALTDFNAELDMTRGLNGTFSGKVNGQSQITGRIVPQGGRSAFAIQSSDAGGVFRSAKLLKQARDGELELFLAPGQGRGVYEGKLVANSIRVKDAPAMAALLNAISLVGILEQLAGEGIHFAEVQAKFQLAPDRVTIYSGSAVGASMGISAEGYYYPETNWLDLEGVLSPIYAVNVLGRVFARRGEGLLGFTYEVDGVASKPRVQVNPLSVLTPGMFREIFRRPPPQQAGQTQAQQNDTPTQSSQTGGQGQDR